MCGGQPCGQRLHRRTGGRQTLRNHSQRHHPHSFLRRLTHPSPGFLLLSTVVNSYDYPGVDDDAADSSHPRACATGHAPPPAAGPPATHQAPRRPHRLPDPPTAQRHSDEGPVGGHVRLPSDGHISARWRRQRAVLMTATGQFPMSLDRAHQTHRSSRRRRPHPRRVLAAPLGGFGPITSQHRQGVGLMGARHRLIGPHQIL